MSETRTPYNTGESGAVWRPRPILSGWTPDQAEVASRLPECRRLCVPAANGVGKTFLAADLVVSFIQDMPAASIIITAPTNRQVNELLWPHVSERLRHVGLADETWQIPIKPKWTGGDDDHLIGFATNRAERLQGFHAANMLIVVDEASGMPSTLIEALEGIAVSANNYIVAIGNPNQPAGAFFEMTRRSSYQTVAISALTHPNILARREVICGATSWAALLSRVEDWCKPTEQLDAADFVLDLCAGAGLQGFIANDAFRVRYLGEFPKTATWSLYSMDDIKAAQEANIPGVSPKIAAVDIAREGGDRTVYGIREGDSVVKIVTISPADLMVQAQEIASRLKDDDVSSVILDAAGMGIGLVDRLAQLTQVPVVAFQGAAEPVSPFLARQYANRRAAAYGNLAVALKAKRCGLPKDVELADELATIRYRHTADGKMIIEDKAKAKARIGKSPDVADMVSLLWESGTDFTWVSASGGRRSCREETAW